MKKLTYCLNVHVTIPLAEDADDVDYMTLDFAKSAKGKSLIERDLYFDLKRLDYDADVEVMDFEVSE